MRFFILGSLKSKAYYPLPSNIVELKTNIERETKSIKAEMLKNSIENFRKRLELVGGHIENFINKGISYKFVCFSSHYFKFVLGLSEYFRFVDL